MHFLCINLFKYYFTCLMFNLYCNTDLISTLNGKNIWDLIGTGFAQNVVFVIFHMNIAMGE